MNSNKRIARIAGMLYLAVVLTGIFSLMYVPSKLIVWDNAATTFNNIANNQTLFRIGIVIGLACYTFFLFLAVTLYNLLSSVNTNYAKLMVLLAVVSVPIFFINSQYEFSVLSLFNDPGYGKVFSNEQLHAQALLLLNQYKNGNLILSIFSGLWLFPFGYLVYKSGFLPKILGILLMLGCFSYLVNFLGKAVVPGYGQSGIASLVQLPASVGEIGICLWLIIMGAKEKPATNNNK